MAPSMHNSYTCCSHKHVGFRYSSFVSFNAGRCQKMLNHTMLLIAAVRLALCTVTDKAIAERYLENIKDYVHDLQQIYPEAPLVPNYHMAFHIYDFLRLFGPAYSWWTFPYERLIGQLQCTSTSNRFGMSKIHKIFAFIY